MHGHLKLVTGPTDEPLTVEEARTHLRAGHTLEDGYIGSLVIVARRWVEQVTGRALVSQTWDYALDCFPRGPTIKIPRAPLRSVESVTYYGRDLVTEMVLDPSLYQVDTLRDPGVIALRDGASWPSDWLRTSSGVVVRFVAGYGDEAADVPADIVHAIKLLVGEMYAFREPEITGTIISKVGFAVDALLAPYHLWGF
jgi:uncharacterized phiE125 gp8 family phage protein